MRKEQGMRPEKQIRKSVSLQPQHFSFQPQKPGGGISGGSESDTGHWGAHLEGGLGPASESFLLATELITLAQLQ